MSVALANIVDGEKLKEVVNSFEFDYGILESIPRSYIGESEELKKELRGEIKPNNFDNGRLFSTDLEIRWRKKGENNFYALIISEGNESLEGYERKNITMRKNHLSFYLWGEKEKAGDKWYELRIPKGWKYPVESKYAKIKVIEYEVKGKQEEGKFYRFYGFEGVDK
jgi:hypothetical protein